MLLDYPQIYLSNYPCFIYSFITDCYIPKSYSISGHEYDLNFYICIKQFLCKLTNN